MWVVHWDLLLRLPWRIWVCPHEGQVWRWYICLHCGGSGSTRHSGELAARAAGNTVLWKDMATSIGQYAPVFLPGEPPSLTEKPGRPQSLGLQRVGHYQSDPVCIDRRLFLPVAALPQWELRVKVVQLLGLQGSWWCPVCSDMDCLHRRSYGPIRDYWASCSWRSEGLFGQSFSVAPPIQALRGLPCLGSFSAVGSSRHIEGPPRLGSYSADPCLRHLKGHPWVGSYSVVQCIRHLMGQALCCSAPDNGEWGERGYGSSSTLCVAQQYHLASMADWLSSTGISLHNLLRHNPLIRLSTVNSSPYPGISPQSLNSSSQPLPLLGQLHPCPWYVWLQ